MADFYFKYSSDFRQILHYFTVFNQCFNERHFLMEISVNRIIIAGLSDQRRGEGGGWGGMGLNRILLSSLDF